MADVVYTTTTCPGCDLLKAQLEAKPIAGLKVYNLDLQPEVKPYFEATGSRSVPTAVIDGRAVMGAYAILAALRAKYGGP